MSDWPWHPEGCRCGACTPLLPTKAQPSQDKCELVGACRIVNMRVGWCVEHNSYWGPGAKMCNTALLAIEQADAERKARVPGLNDLSTERAAHYAFCIVDGCKVDDPDPLPKRYRPGTIRARLELLLNDLIGSGVDGNARASETESVEKQPATGGTARKAPMPFGPGSDIAPSAGTQALPPGQDPPDAGCYTLPNGECVSSGPCMHSAPGQDEIGELVRRLRAGADNDDCATKTELDAAVALERLAANLTARNARIAESNAEITTLLGQKAILRCEVAEAQTEIEQLERENKRLCDQWPSEDERAAKAQAEIVKLKRQVEIMGMEIGTVDADLQAENAVFKEALGLIASHVEGRGCTWDAEIASTALGVKET